MKQKTEVLKIEGAEVRAKAVAPGVFVVKVKGALLVNPDHIYKPFSRRERTLANQVGHSEENREDTMLFTTRKTVIEKVLGPARA